LTTISSKIIYIYYQGDISTQSVNTIIGVVTQILANEKPDIIYFLFSSHGGEVDAGVTLYNFLKSLSPTIIMHNIGTIDSIANVVFVAAEERYAAPHAVFLFHGVSMQFSGGLSLPQMNELRDRILNNHNTIAGIICGNTKMKETTIKKLFSQGQTKDVAFALQEGIINEVKLPQIPQNASIVTININS
jgi:ATP-dependent protease ClpP protease subunit